MDDTTPPLHPLEREQLEEHSTLVVTVQSRDEFHDDVLENIQALDRNDSVDSTPTLSFPSYDALLETLTPRRLELIETVRQEEPDSINEAARLVDRDVKNVHEELTELAQLTLVYFVEEGQAKRPVVWFDELDIELDFDPEASDRTPATS